MSPLVFEIPHPPLYNRCIRHASFGAYPSKDYCTWLEVAHEIIGDAMREAGAEMDTEHCWEVEIQLTLGTGRRGDVDGYIKPILDALGGARPNEKRRIVRDGQVYKDDQQVIVVSCLLAIVKMPEEWVGATVTCRHTDPPADYQKQQAAERRAARDAARLERACAK